MTARRRIWCETVTAEEAASPGVVALLARYRVHPILAVWPTTVEAATRAVRAMRDAGLEPALWPMLEDREGRWLNATNVSRFAPFVASRAAGDATEIVLDLEPPIADLRAALAMRALPVAVDARTFHDARAAIAALVDAIQATGTRVSAAIPPPVLFDPLRPPRAGWQLRLATPADGITWSHVSPMLYSSMVEGWSRGLLDRADALAFLAWGCRAARERFGAAAGASLGAVGVGALGDEPTYRSPEELAEDVATAVASGTDDLALFDLGGVLRRPPAERWLDAFTRAPARVDVSSTFRVDGLVVAARTVGKVFCLTDRASW